MHQADISRVQGFSTVLAVLTGTSFLISIGLLVMYQIWSFRAYRNVCEEEKTQVWRNYWSLLGWIVPFINLIFPGLVLSRIWTTYQNKAISDHRLKSGPEVVWIWWALFAVSCTLSLLQFAVVFFGAGVFNFQTRSLEGLFNAMVYINLIDQVINMSSLLVLSYVISKIHSFELAWSKKLQETN